MAKKINISIDCILELIDTVWKDLPLEEIARKTGLPYDRVDKLVDQAILKFPEILPYTQICAICRKDFLPVNLVLGQFETENKMIQTLVCCLPCFEK